MQYPARGNTPTVFVRFRTSRHPGAACAGVLSHRWKRVCGLADRSLHRWKGGSHEEGTYGKHTAPCAAGQ